jgi:hypothetical protein
LSTACETKAQRRTAITACLALCRELPSNGEAKSRQSSGEVALTGVRLDLISAFEAKSRRSGERD